MHKRYTIEHLLSRRLQGLTTDEENDLINGWAAETPENKEILDRLETEKTLREDLTTLFQLVDMETGESRLMRMKAHIEQTVNKGRPGDIPRNTWYAWQRGVAAAVILVILSLGGYYYMHETARPIKPQEQEISADVHPGRNLATLTFADGQTIALSEAQKGIVIGQAISYLDGSAVTNKRENSLAGEKIVELKLSTPRGGTYQLTLPDGTMVWLNAASTLKYPSRFDKIRMVELTGEAYFEVSKQSSSLPNSSTAAPFLVKTSTQTVQVLGTQFNVMAYSDEPSIKTTLVEGKVRIASTGNAWLPTIMKPGEQAITSGANLNIAAVNIAQYTAWKEGRFYFNKTPLEEVMRQISRWYDIDVVYQQGIPKASFSGKVSRDASLAELLDILQQSAINIRLEGRKLVVN